MKTYKEWEASDLELNEYLAYPQEIDEELYMHMWEVVVPGWSSKKIYQNGEPVFEEDDILYYWTACEIGERYFFLGILPAFKHSDD